MVHGTRTSTHTHRKQPRSPRLHDGVVLRSKDDRVSAPKRRVMACIHCCKYTSLDVSPETWATWTPWMTGADLHADHARPFIYTCVYIYVYVYVCYRMYVHIYIYVDISLFVYLFVYLSIYSFIDLSTCTHTHVYIYINTKVFTRKTAGVVGICRGNMATSYMGNWWGNGDVNADVRKWWYIGSIPFLGMGNLWYLQRQWGNPEPEPK